MSAEAATLAMSMTGRLIAICGSPPWLREALPARIMG